MMFFYIFLLILICLSCGWYFLYFKPKKYIQKFAKEAQNLGYKVKLMPFQFMSYYLMSCVDQDDKSLKIFKEQFSKYDLIVGNLMSSLSIIPLDLNMLKDLFKHLNKLPKHPFITEAFQTLSSGGTPFTQGQIWKRKRRIISSVFHFDFLNEMIPLIKNQTQRQLIKINYFITQKKQINVQKSFIKILSSIVSKCFFGTNLQEYQVQGKPYCDFYVDYLDQLSNYVQSLQYVLIRMKSFKYGFTKKGRNLKNKYDILFSIAKQVTDDELKKVKNQTQTKKNLVNLLYNNGLLQDLNKQNSQSYGIQDLVGQFFAFFAAGTDTTTNTLSLILHYLSQNQNLKYVEKIKQQHRQIKKMNLSQSEQLKHMKWIEAIFNQTLRINGPVSRLFNRLATQNIMLGSLKIEKGTQINVSPLINHWKRQNFKNPDKFLPERWIQNPNLVPYSFLPFGAGQRNCIGQYLSKIQTKIIISTIIQRYNFKALQPLKMKLGFVYSNQNNNFMFQHGQKE